MHACTYALYLACQPTRDDRLDTIIHRDNPTQSPKALFPAISQLCGTVSETTNVIFCCSGPHHDEGSKHMFFTQPTRSASLHFFLNKQGIKDPLHISLVIRRRRGVGEGPRTDGAVTLFVSTWTNLLEPNRTAPAGKSIIYADGNNKARMGSQRFHFFTGPPWHKFWHSQTSNKRQARQQPWRGTSRPSLTRRH